jgi:chorismate--pyruvate lyase
MLPWLLDTGSLTQRLVAACPGAFAVRLLGQQRTRPLREEAAALELVDGVQALVRQVQLQCDTQPWVLARTVIPLTTLTGPRRRLTHLGNRSLGAVLFADPTMARDPVEVTRLTPGSPLYAAVTASLRNPPAELWGRRSVFRLGGRPLLVSEFFLPSIARFPR